MIRLVVWAKSLNIVSLHQLNWLSSRAAWKRLGENFRVKSSLAECLTDGSANARVALFRKCLSFANDSAETLISKLLLLMRSVGVCFQILPCPAVELDRCQSDRRFKSWQDSKSNRLLKFKLSIWKALKLKSLKLEFLNWNLRMCLFWPISSGRPWWIERN